MRLSQKEEWSDVKYDHIWGGQFDDEVDNAIISASWFNSAIDAHVKLGFKPRGVKVVAHDPSDLGPDPKGMAVRHGVVITRCEEKDNGDVNEGCDWACDIAINENADVFIYDGDGIGAALRKQIDGNFFGKKIESEMYKGSRGVDDPDKFYQPDDTMNRKQAKTNK